MNKQIIGKITLAAAIAVIAGLFMYFDLGRFLTLDYLKESRAQFQELYHNHALLVIAAYMGVYILVTALSLPGAAILTLAGGAMLGFWMGSLVISFASTIGATLACLAARFLFRDAVQRRFAERLTAINEGIAREGAFYLFTLRLIPIFPFFVINLVMGLSKLPIRTFFWVSQLGMLPGTLVYVNAGRQLGQLDSLKGILSPALIGSFALLGIFPLLVKRGLSIYKGSRGEQ